MSRRVYFSEFPSHPAAVTLLAGIWLFCAGFFVTLGYTWLTVTPPQYQTWLEQGTTYRLNLANPQAIRERQVQHFMMPSGKSLRPWGYSSNERAVYYGDYWVEWVPAPPANI